MSGSDKIGDTRLLEHFQLESNPFSPRLNHSIFFEIFHMDPAQPFTFDQTMVYIQFLLNETGPDHQIVIEEEAHEALYRLSDGRVGQINTLMDQALRKAFSDRTQVISQRHVEDMGDENAIAEDEIFKESLSTDEDSEHHKIKSGVKIPKPGNTVPIMVVAILLLGLACGVWLLGGSKQSPTLRKKTDAAKSATQEPLKKTQKPSTPANVPGSEKNAAKRAIHSDERVANFLAEYNLQAYERPFSDALYDENFEEVTRQIYNETGLMLIHFTTLPPTFKKKYHILDKLLINPVHIRYFLFWKPAPVIPAWEYGASGKPIQQVQTMLKKIGIYQGAIDGVVGVELVRAILRFQGQNLLEKTGKPDTTTLFFLTALSQ